MNKAKDSVMKTFNDDIKPKFKPGNTPSVRLGNEELNANIPWGQILQSILPRYPLDILAEKLNTSTSALKALQNNDISSLDFRTGAKLLAVHCCVFPALYA
tara:strand:- start:211 stop:513 length:303 start_codon:yes stop_codon:yes gene_type:complete